MPGSGRVCAPALRGFLPLTGRTKQLVDVPACTSAPRVRGTAAAGRAYFNRTLKLANTP